MSDLQKIQDALAASGQPPWTRVPSATLGTWSWVRHHVGAHIHQDLDVTWTLHKPPRLRHAWVETHTERGTTTARFDRLDLLVEYLTGPDVNPEARS